MSSERTLLGMDIDSNDETAMWERARGGDGVAFASLFTRHQDRVYRRALTLVSQVSNAEDVTATAFFELWRRRNSVRLVEGSVLPWLLVTTVNLARNQSRASTRYRRLIASLPHETTVDAESVAITNVHTELLGVRLTVAIGRLSSQDAALLVLTVLDELTVADAASALGIKPGAARMRLLRARQRLQADLANDRPLTSRPTPEGEHA
jgi:RNA polymerase sigma factor (sigma-70 family)